MNWGAPRKALIYRPIGVKRSEVCQAHDTTYRAPGLLSHRSIQPSQGPRQNGTIVQHLAFKFRESFNKELHIMINGNVSVRLQRFQQHNFAILRHDGLAKWRVDAVLD